MTDYFEFDGGTERNLEELLIWWGTREPFEHTDECDGVRLHCCEGKNPLKCLQSLEATAFAFKWSERNFIPVAFRSHPSADPVLMEPGDRIYYRGNDLYELVRNDPHP